MENHTRRRLLLKLLEQRQQASTAELGELLHASMPTVRRDLNWLAERKLLTRTHGGAVHLPQLKRGFPLSGQPLLDSLTRQAAAKRAIARHAAGMCSDGETIIINGGSTTFMMTEFLASRQLRILTNSFVIAQRLLYDSDNEIIIPSGKVYREQNVILSPFDNDVIQHHYASRIFMSVFGISQLGLVETDTMLVQAEQQLIGQAEEMVVLADSSKFEHRSGMVLCGLERVGMVVTDIGIGDAAAQWLEQAGVRVTVVAPDAGGARQ